MPPIQDMKSRRESNLPFLSSDKTAKPAFKPSPYRNIVSSIRSRASSVHNSQENLAAAVAAAAAAAAPAENPEIASPLVRTKEVPQKVKSKLLDVDFKAPAPVQQPKTLRRSRTTADVGKEALEDNAGAKKTAIAEINETANNNNNNNDHKLTSNKRSVPTLLLRRMIVTRKADLANGAADQSNVVKAKAKAKAFSSPSELAASKSSLYKTPIVKEPKSRIIRIIGGDATANVKKPENNNRTKFGEMDTEKREEDENEIENENETDEDFGEKQMLVIKWLDDVDPAFRPPTPPSRLPSQLGDTHAIDLSESSDVATAIHIVYSDAGDTES